MDRSIRIITHSGTFHLDELLAIAALTLLLGDRPYEIIRTRDMAVIATGDYVVDVGGVYDPLQNRFDHHQEGGAGARNNVPYSSFGLVWKTYGEQLCGGKEVAERIERHMVYPVDMADNGVPVYQTTSAHIHPYLLHHFVHAYRPTWKEGDKYDEYFADILPCLRGLLAREIVVAQDTLLGTALVREIYMQATDRRIIIIPEPQYPWMEELMRYGEPIFVVKPKPDNSAWSVEGVRNDVDSFKVRKQFPETWRGKINEELQKITGVADALFCHNAGFIAVAQSEAGARQLAQMALDA